MKYYTANGLSATLYGDIKASRRCFEAASKGLNTIAPRPKAPNKPALPESSEEQKPLPHVNYVDLDSRFSTDDVREEQHGTRNPSTSSCKLAHPARPIPDGEFELVLLGEDPHKGVKIGTGLPELARKQLTACLQENANLFA